MFKRAIFVGSLFSILGACWFLGKAQPPKKSVPLTAEKPVVIAEAKPAVPSENLEPPTPLTEHLDLSRAFQPAPEDQVSEIVLASFTFPQETEKAPKPVSLSSESLLQLDAIQPLGLRLSWMQIPFQQFEKLDIAPRIVQK